MLNKCVDCYIYGYNVSSYKQCQLLSFKELHISFIWSNVEKQNPLCPPAQGF